MKTKVIIAALLTVISSASFATGEEKKEKKASATVEVTRQNAHVFNLTYKGSNNDKVEVSIYNENNKVVFSEIIKKYDAFNRPYNLSKLPEGLYTVKVTDTNGTIVKEINHSTSVENISTISMVKFDSVASDKYKLTIINQGSKKAKITIFSGDNEVLYTSNQSINGNFATIFNLAQVKAKTVEVSVNGKVSVYNL